MLHFLLAKIRRDFTMPGAASVFPVGFSVGSIVTQQRGARIEATRLLEGARHAIETDML